MQQTVRHVRKPRSVAQWLEDEIRDASKKGLYLHSWQVFGDEVVAVFASN